MEDFRCKADSVRSHIKPHNKYSEEARLFTRIASWQSCFDGDSTDQLQKIAC